MRNINYPENIKKQGWNQMNDLLNKEMPQRHSKRRVLIILMIFALISTIGLYNISSKNSPGAANKDIKSDQSNIEMSYLRENKATKENIINEYSVPKLAYKSQYRRDKTRQTFDQKKPILKNNQNAKTKVIWQEVDAEKILDEPNIASNSSTGSRSKVEEIYGLFTLNSTILTEHKEPMLLGISVNKPMNYFKWYINPFSEIRVFNNSAEKIEPKFEFSVGNTFDFNRRFFFDISIGYTNSQLLVSTVKLTEDYAGAGADAKEIELYDNKGTDRKSIKRGILEMSIYEGYRFNRKFALKAGGGISFTKGINKALTKNTSIFAENDKGIEINYDNNGTINLSDSYIIPDYTYFTDINAQYMIGKKISLNVGYKYYFNNYNVLTDTQRENVYRAFVIQPPLISNFYLGLKYNFRR